MTDIVVNWFGGAATPVATYNNTSQLTPAVIFTDMVETPANTPTGVSLEMIAGFSELEGIGAGGSPSPSPPSGLDAQWWYGLASSDDSGDVVFKASGFPALAAVQVDFGGTSHYSLNNLNRSTEIIGSSFSGGTYPDVGIGQVYNNVLTNISINPVVTINLTADGSGSVFFKIRTVGSILICNGFRFIYDAVILPSITGPSTQAGDDANLSIATSLASTTAPVSIEFSKDGFSTILGEIFPDVASQTAIETVIDFDAGFEQTLLDGIARACIPHTRNGVSCRWKLFEDDDTTPMYLEFTHNPKAGFVALAIVKSQYEAGNSLLDAAFQYLGEQDQHYMPEAVTGGVPTPLNADYGDIDHPQPNYMGGDSETFVGSVVSVMYFERDRMAHRITTPIEDAPAVGVFKEEFQEEFT